MTINRFCSSGLQAIAQAADRIKAGGAEVILAGGTESMSYVPVGGNKITLNPWLVENYPGSYMSMGQTASAWRRITGLRARRWISSAMSRTEKALAAQEAGRFDDEIVPVEVTTAVRARNRRRRR